jgi:hypothetical protein
LNLSVCSSRRDAETSSRLILRFDDIDFAAALLPARLERSIFVAGRQTIGATMKIFSGVLIAAFSVGVFALSSSPTSAATMKECAAQWQQMKAAKQTEGKKYKDFSKSCMSGSAAAPAAAPAPAPAAAAKPAAPAPATAAAKPAEKTAAKPASAGREAMYARERACGTEWKADKAAGKVPAGMKWPQYWSACDKRKKAAGL